MADWKAFFSAESEAQFRQFWSFMFAQDSVGLASDGVLQGLGVSQQTSASKFVDVGIGCGLVQDSTSNGVSPIVNGSVKAVDVLNTDVAESNPRNDLIVYDSSTSTVHKIKGTAAATPTDPTVPATAVKLARVRVKSAATYAGTEVVAAADIDDLRVYTSLFGARPANKRVAGVKATVSTDASGYATVTHGAGFTPSVVTVSGGNPTTQGNILGTDTYTSTTFRVRAVTGAGAVYTGSVVVCATLWE